MKKSLKYKRFYLYSHSVSKNRYLIYSGIANDAFMLTNREAQILFFCTKFDTLNNHALSFYFQERQNIITHGSSLNLRILRFLMRHTKLNKEDIPIQKQDMNFILSCLDEFVKNSLLISKQELLEEIRSI